MIGAAFAGMRLEHRCLPLSAPAQEAAKPAHIPIWQVCLVPVEAALKTTRWDYQSSLPSRGLAAAAIMRPSAVLASFDDPKQHTGASLTNLSLALEAINKLVIPPGAEFSFNGAVGPRLESRGYEPGLMYQQGQVIDGVGGGVCIASTALYNAALLAGLPILERWMHSGPVSYAEPARDASVVYGVKDLRIQNSTPYPVWIRATVTDGRVNVSLLSYQKSPYQIVLREEGPGLTACPIRVQPIDAPQARIIRPGTPGCDATLIREFLRDGNRAKQEVICHDVRQGLPRVIGMPKEVSPGSPVQIPTAPEGSPDMPALGLGSLPGTQPAPMVNGSPLGLP